MQYHAAITQLQLDIVNKLFSRTRALTRAKQQVLGVEKQQDSNLTFSLTLPSIY